MNHKYFVVKKKINYYFICYNKVVPYVRITHANKIIDLIFFFLQYKVTSHLNFVHMEKKQTTNKHKKRMPVANHQLYIYIKL